MGVALPTFGQAHSSIPELLTFSRLRRNPWIFSFRYHDCCAVSSASITTDLFSVSQSIDTDTTMTTKKSRSPIAEKGRILSRVSKGQLDIDHFSMDCDSPRRVASAENTCSPTNCANAFQIDIIRDALCVIASNQRTIHEDSYSTPARSKTCRHPPSIHRDRRNPWNSPETFENRGPRLQVIPPPPPPPPRRVFVASIENFHPTPILSMDFPNTPGDAKKRVVEHDKENEVQILYKTPTSSPSYKKPKLTMKTTQHYTVDGKLCVRQKGVLGQIIL